MGTIIGIAIIIFLIGFIPALLNELWGE